MTLSKFLRIALSVVVGVALSSCAHDPAAAAKWPGASFSTVKAFVYDCDADKTVSFFQKDGSETKGVINKGGAVLNAEQVQRLQKILRTPTPKVAHTACFIPHHAFVFYGPNGAPVGRVEVCFTCDTHRAYPGGLPSHVSMTDLWTLLGELDVARGEGRKFYQDLYQQTCSRR